jgi:predicted ATPase
VGDAMAVTDTGIVARKHTVPERLELSIFRLKELTVGRRNQLSHGTLRKLLFLDYLLSRYSTRSMTQQVITLRAQMGVAFATIQSRSRRIEFPR